MLRNRQLNVRKATVMALIANSLQVVLVLAIAAIVLINPSDSSVARLSRYGILVAAAVVIVGAVLDIRDALRQRTLLSQMDSMDETIASMEELNLKLRSQRHDFLNHLQVVYSLMEMEEYGEARDYIEKVYGEITSLGRSLRTANAAVNALLQVKLGACEKAGIEAETQITSTWKDLPMPGWEMCKVLSNLIDNAMDALQGTAHPKLTLTMTEDIRSYRFSVADNGEPVPEKLKATIFQPGVTSKSDGHGMGLAIVKGTLESYGGGIELSEENGITCFAGWVPKQEAHAE